MAYNDNYTIDEFGETINDKNLVNLEDYGDDEVLPEDRMGSMQDDEFHETLHSGHLDDQLNDPALAAEVEEDYRLDESDDRDNKTAA